MASGQIITIKLMRGGESSSWGFRLQGGKDFAVPLTVIRVNPSSLADQGGLLVGDVVVKINGRNADLMRHKEAQDVIFNTGNNLELTVHRGEMTTWKPNVTPIQHPIGNTTSSRPTSRLFDEPTPLTKTSLAANIQEYRPVNSQNVSAKPFVSQKNPSVQLVHKQYNSPISLYSESKIAETIEAHTELLATGVKGINFLKPDAPVNTHSPTYELVHEEDEKSLKEHHPEETKIRGSQIVIPTDMIATKHVDAPITKPFAERTDKSGQNVCSECGRTIIGHFAKAGDKLLHPECFRCSTCGTSLKNVGYFNVNDKLYCDIHAKQVATLMTPRFDPNSISPGIRVPSTVNIACPGTSPPRISIPQSDQLQSSGKSSPSVVGAIPYHNIQGVHHVNPPSLLSTTCTSYSHAPAYSSIVPPPVAPKPKIQGYATYQPGSFHTGAKFAWPPPNQPGQNNTSYNSTTTIYPQSGTQHSINHESVKLNQATRTVTSTYYQPQSLYKPRSTEPATYSPTYSQPIKVPPPTAPKPQINPPWIGSNISSSLPGQSLIPGSRPAPRRGRGLLKPQVYAGTIPICSTCGSPIRGPFILALNKTWCLDHFVCSYVHCKRSLQDIGFVEEQGQLYCEHCYEAFLAPICAKCNIRIKGDCLNALDKQWHTTCFICTYCKRPFGNSSFYLEDGFPYCEKDWNELFTTKCVGCGFAIEAGDRWVEALNQNYHSTCFKCTVCSKNLEGQSFYAKGGRPYCKSHAR